MAFGGVFYGFRPAFDAGGAVTPWYLSGGIAAGDCVAAYLAKGAASYAASLVNLPTPGTNDALPLTGAPDWTTALGWIGKAGCSGLQVGTYTTSGGVYTAIVRLVGGPTWTHWLTTSGISQLNITGRGANTHCYYVGGSTSGDFATGVAGVFCVSADTTPAQSGYMNGLAEKTNWTVNSVADAVNLRCGLNTSTGWSIQAVAWYSRKLTDAEVLAVSTAMAAL